MVSRSVRRMAEENDDKGKGAGSGDDKAKGGAPAADDKGKGAGGGGEDKAKGGGGEKTYSQADLDAAVAAARQEARKTKSGKSAGKDKAKKDDDESEESPELIEARKRADTAEANLRVRNAQDAVETAAKAAGFKNPTKIYRLVKDELSFSDDGKPENVKDLIAIAKKDYAEELEANKGNGSADGGAGARSGAGAGTSMNDIIRRAAGRL
jgi:hypothetical protein